MGAVLSIISNDGSSYLKAAKHGTVEEMLQQLNSSPKRLTATTLMSRRNAFHLLAAQGRTEALQILLQHIHECPVQLRLPVASLNAFCNSLINSPDVSRRTPLILAAKHGHPDTLAHLLSVGANLSVGDWHGNTAVHYAALLGNVACLELLLTAAASSAPHEISRTNLSGYTPLHYAVWGQHADAAQMLLGFGANICATSWRNWDPYVPCLPWTTPLHIAAIHNQVSTACLLLKVHMDRVEACRAEGLPEPPDPRLALNHYGNTAQDVALQLNRRRLGRLLQPGLPLRRMMRVMGLDGVTLVGVPRLSSISAAAYTEMLRTQLQQLAQEGEADEACPAAPAAVQQPPQAQQHDSPLRSQPEARHAQQLLQQAEQGREVHVQLRVHAASPCRQHGPSCGLACGHQRTSTRRSSNASDSSDASGSTCKAECSAAAAAADEQLKLECGGCDSCQEDEEDVLAADLVSPSGPLPLEALAERLSISKAGGLAILQHACRHRLQRQDSCQGAPVCDVCFEERRLLDIRPCHHSICTTCALAMCQQEKQQPLPCPFCRELICGFSSRPRAVLSNTCLHT